MAWLANILVTAVPVIAQTLWEAFVPGSERSDVEGLGDEDGRFEFGMGDLNFTLDLEGRTFLAAGQDHEQYLISFADTGNDGGVISDSLPITTGERLEVTSVMRRFQTGSIAFAPFELQEEHGQNQAGLLLHADEVFNDVLEFSRRDGSYRLERAGGHFTFTTENEYTAIRMTLVDYNGVSFTVDDRDIEVDGSQYKAEMTMPKGFSQTLPYRHLLITLTIPEFTFNKIQAAMRNGD